MRAGWQESGPAADAGHRGFTPPSLAGGLDTSPSASFADAEARLEALRDDLDEQRRRRHLAELRSGVAEKRASEALAELALVKRSFLWRLGQPLRRRFVRAWRRWLRRPNQSADYLALASLFDREWYLARNPDVAAAGIDPLVHYLRYGAGEGRDPQSGFETVWYVAANPDVEAAGVNALAHYARFGLPEGRRPASRYKSRDGAGAAYNAWQWRFDYNRPRDRPGYLAKIAGLARRPSFAVVMPVYNPEPAYLKAAIASVEAQIYPDWELCIADDASTDPRIRPILAAAVARDRRIRVVLRPENGHISAATNSAFDLVTAEYVALLDHDDILREHALAEVAFALDGAPDAGLIYSDEDKLDAAGERVEPLFKPDFSPDLFRSINYLNHLTVHRAANIRAVGGWREGFEGSQDYDLSLRVLDRVDPHAVVHIPKVLYHWRAVAGSAASAGKAKTYAYDAGLRALREDLSRRGLRAAAEAVPERPYYRVKWRVPDPPPLVSLIVPTRDRLDDLRLCVASILSATTYPNYEIVIIDNQSEEPATLAWFREVVSDRRVRVIPYARPFNFSAICNFAVGEVASPIVGLVNNDIEVIDPGWLDEMVSHAARPEIGCVGAKLLYPDGTVQHAGVIVGLGGVAGHGHLSFPQESPGYFWRLAMVQNLSAVTGACLVMRRDLYREVGGMDEEQLKVAFNDIDLCLKVREAGYLNLFTPHALLYHRESASRGYEDTPEKQARFAAEIGVMKARWGGKLLADPYYSPNLTLDRTDFSVRIR